MFNIVLYLLYCIILYMCTITDLMQWGRAGAAEQLATVNVRTQEAIEVLAVCLHHKEIAYILYGQAGGGGCCSQACARSSSPRDILHARTYPHARTKAYTHEHTRAYMLYHTRTHMLWRTCYSVHTAARILCASQPVSRRSSPHVTQTRHGTSACRGRNAKYSSSSSSSLLLLLLLLLLLSSSSSS